MLRIYESANPGGSLPAALAQVQQDGERNQSPQVSDRSQRKRDIKAAGFEF